MFNTKGYLLLQYLKSFLKRCFFYGRIFLRRACFLLSRQNRKLKKLHLGCGNIYLNGYINIDVSFYSAADIVLNIQNINKYFKKNTIQEILMVHTISYLRLFDARRLLVMCFHILMPEGKLIIEFPDVVKCSKMIIDNNDIQVQEGKENLFRYIEGIRGFYAFDLDQIKNKVRFTPYTFGWSANHMKYELTNLGFRQILISDGNAHQRPQRDTKIEATK
jgi:hypothetical protein